MATTKTLLTDEGHETTLDAFIADNAECMDEQTQCILYCLRIGETYSEPGGGSAAWSVTRTA